MDIRGAEHCFSCLSADLNATGLPLGLAIQEDALLTQRLAFKMHLYPYISLLGFFKIPLMPVLNAASFLSFNSCPN